MRLTLAVILEEITHSGVKRMVKSTDLRNREMLSSDIASSCDLST